MNINMPTSLAGGRYQLGQLVGRGGMAEVHVALDTRLGRTVAVKIMRADFANDKIFLERFRREAHSVAQMNNPNIVNIYDSGEELVSSESGDAERLPYIVMEYVKGQTLRDIIKVNGALSQRDCEQVMLGVLNALDYSHRMGIIHRDIKPGNIMISEQGVVKVMDFGIARAIDDSAATMTQSQGVVGTAQYLSPEQARGESVDIPRYDFITGRRTWHKNPLTLDERSILIIEGIHGLNPRLTPSIPDAQKFRIYISCFTSVAMDNLSRIATTDNRLLRRLTRDYRTRGNDALSTLARWESVRRGEEKHIFPYQENADVMFNSSLFYEISVLRRFAEPILREVPDTVPEYGEAKRMLKFLDNFIPISPEEIPPTSLLREFIGGSSFKY